MHKYGKKRVEVKGDYEKLEEEKKPQESSEKPPAPPKKKENKPRTEGDVMMLIMDLFDKKVSLVSPLVKRLSEASPFRSIGRGLQTWYQKGWKEAGAAVWNDLKEFKNDVQQDYAKQKIQEKGIDTMVLYWAGKLASKGISTLCSGVVNGVKSLNQLRKDYQNSNDPDVRKELAQQYKERIDELGDNIDTLIDKLDADLKDVTLSDSERAEMNSLRKEMIDLSEVVSDTKDQLNEFEKADAKTQKRILSETKATLKEAEEAVEKVSPGGP